MIYSLFKMHFLYSTDLNHFSCTENKDKLKKYVTLDYNTDLSMTDFYGCSRSCIHPEPFSTGCSVRSLTQTIIAKILQKSTNTNVWNNNSHISVPPRPLLAAYHLYRF